MVKMAGILKFQLNLGLMENVVLNMSLRGAIMHIDCIPDLDASLYCFRAGISFSNL
jgi:hypothetical protein